MGTRRTIDDGRVLVSQFKESGLTQKEFALETGVNVCTLQYWMRKTGWSDNDGKARFVELKTGAGTDGHFLLNVQIGSDVTMRFATLPPPRYLAELSREMKTC